MLTAVNPDLTFSIADIAFAASFKNDLPSGESMSFNEVPISLYVASEAALRILKGVMLAKVDPGILDAVLNKSKTP